MALNCCSLAQRGDALAPLLRSATQDAALRAQGVLNHLFLLLVLPVLVIAAAALLAALAYRRITLRSRAADFRVQYWAFCS